MVCSRLDVWFEGFCKCLETSGVCAHVADKQIVCTGVRARIRLLSFARQKDTESRVQRIQVVDRRSVRSCILDHSNQGTSTFHQTVPQ